MTPEQTELVERVRALIAEEADVREVAMFGGRAVMVNEKMVVSARKDGGLLVCVDPDRHDELTERPGAAHAEMGPGRLMSRGWIAVSAEVLGDDEELGAWVEIAMAHNRDVTGGGA